MFRTSAAVATLLLLAGCTSDLSDDGGFVSATGVVTVIEEADRVAPDPVVEGETLEGEPVSLADFAGKVVVVPVWGSWCAPCIAEAPMLADAAKDLASKNVAFLGINTRDAQVAQAQGFVRTHGIPYPSIYDPDGFTLLSFHGEVSTLLIPSVLFIDTEGRIAAAVRGEITHNMLYDVIEEVT